MLIKNKVKADYWKTGHSYMKRRVNESGALVGFDVEIARYIAASLGFLFSLGSQGIDAVWVLALLAGGLVAAPIAAWLVRLIPPRILGSAVGGVIVLTNTRTIIRSDWVGLAGTPAQAWILTLLAVVWAAAVVWSVRAYRREKVVATTIVEVAPSHDEASATSEREPQAAVVG